MQIKRIDSKKIYEIFLFFFVFSLSVLQITAGHDWGDDFAQYIEQTEAIISDSVPEFVEANSFIVYNSPVSMATAVYPWGFSLALLPSYFFSDGNMIAMKLTQALVIALSAFCFFKLILNKFRLPFAVVASLCFGMNHRLTMYANQLISDPLFLLLVILSFISMNEWNEPGKTKKWNYLAFGVFSAIAYMTRSHGLLLIPALFFCQLVCIISPAFVARFGFCVPDYYKNDKKKETVMNCLLPYFSFFLFFFLYRKLCVQPERSTLYFLESLTPEILINNLKYYALLMADMIPFPRLFSLVFYFLCLGLIVIGLIEEKEKNLFVLIFSVGLVASCIFFPWHQGVRYILSAFPGFLLYTMYGLKWIMSRFRINKRIKLSASLLLCFVFGFATVYTGIDNMLNKGKCETGAYSDSAKEIYSFIRDYTNEDDIIAFQKPRQLWHETERLCFSPGSNVNNLEIADYYITSPREEVTGDPDLLSDNQEYTAIYENKDFSVYKLR